MRIHFLIALPLVAAAASCSVLVETGDLVPCSDLASVGEKCGACGQSKIVCSDGTPACEDPRKVGDACGACRGSALVCSDGALVCPEPSKLGTVANDVQTPGVATTLQGKEVAIARSSSLAIAWKPTTTSYPGITQVQLSTRRFAGLECDASSGDPLCKCNESGCTPVQGYQDAAPDTVVVTAYRYKDEPPGDPIGQAELPIGTLMCDNNECDSTVVWTYFDIPPLEALDFGDSAFITFETRSPVHFLWLPVSPDYVPVVRTWQRNPLKDEPWKELTDRGIGAGVKRLDCPL